jgi:hypothetical protein
MIPIADAQVIERYVLPPAGAVRSTYQLNPWTGVGTVGGGGYLVVTVQMKRLEPQVRCDEQPSPEGSRIQPGDVQSSDPWQKWLALLETFRALKQGWNSYTAPAPNETALCIARMFLAELRALGSEPTRLAPSAMGGVAITQRKGARKGFVEFYNDGRVYALFSDRKGEMRVIPVQADSSSFRKLIMEVRDFLNG